jgi:hypothetical protein
VFAGVGGACRFKGESVSLGIGRKGKRDRARRRGEGEARGQRGTVSLL